MLLYPAGLGLEYIRYYMVVDSPWPKPEDEDTAATVSRGLRPSLPKALQSGHASSPATGERVKT